MARRTTKRAKATASKNDATQMVVSYSQVITYVFVGAIIGLAIGALALLMVLSANNTKQAESAALQARVLQTY
jgi:hypothetical protein